MTAFQALGEMTKEAARGDQLVKALRKSLEAVSQQSGSLFQKTDTTSRIKALLGRGLTDTPDIPADDIAIKLQRIIAAAKNPAGKGSPIWSTIAPMATGKWVNPTAREFKNHLPYTLEPSEIKTMQRGAQKGLDSLGY